jgi:hypothetical protein
MIGVKVAPRHERSENNANNAICQINIEYSLKNLYNIGKIKKILREYYVSISYVCILK